MWNPLEKSGSDCARFRDLLEAGGRRTPAAALREHAAECPECEAAAVELAASRELLSVLPRQPEAGPWFAPRVMAAIRAREAELRRSVDAWIIVPKLARRLTWLSALALVLASTWLFGGSAATTWKPVATDITGEPVHDYAAPVNNDDLLLSLAEKGS
jgi:hypothetical protein